MVIVISVYLVWDGFAANVRVSSSESNRTPRSAKMEPPCVLATSPQPILGTFHRAARRMPQLQAESNRLVRFLRRPLWHP